MATFSGAGACTRARISGMSTDMNQLLSLGGMNVGYFRSDLLEVQRAGLEERMGDVDLELPRAALLERRADRAVMEAVGQDRIDDAERGLVLGILEHRLAVLVEEVHGEFDLVEGRVAGVRDLAGDAVEE